MYTENHIDIYGDIDQIYKAGSEIEHWPELLPHYRWVRILKPGEQRRVVEMAAHRDGFPCKWVSIQERYPAEHRIVYKHIGGITRGMDVGWHIASQGDHTHVTITHDFELGWPLIGGFISKYIIGKWFVHNIADKTLACIKRHIESAAQRVPQAQPEKRTP